MVDQLQSAVSLKPYTTLKAGGSAEWFAVARDRTQLANLAIAAHQGQYPLTILGWGSNVLPAEAGVPGIVLWNRAKQFEIRSDGVVEFETGCGFQDVFLKAAQAGLGGLEYAVGIPGTLGGALASNAGAYRSNVSEFITELHVVSNGVAQWVKPEIMQFSYRDSILRQPNAPPLVVLSVRMKLPKRKPKEIYDEAREYQRQRIGKQPPQASAGSFFKNVNSVELASRLDSLPEKLKASGVVPAGYLIQESGLMGLRHGGAMLSRRHANFIVNFGGATSTDIRQLAEIAKARVLSRFGVTLEEEVLYLGDWSTYLPAA